MLLPFNDDFILQRKSKRNKDFVVVFQLHLRPFRRRNSPTNVCEHSTWH